MSTRIPNDMQITGRVGALGVLVISAPDLAYPLLFPAAEVMTPHTSGWLIGDLREAVEAGTVEAIKEALCRWVTYAGRQALPEWDASVDEVLTVVAHVLQWYEPVAIALGGSAPDATTGPRFQGQR